MLDADDREIGQNERPTRGISPPGSSNRSVMSMNADTDEAIAVRLDEVLKLVRAKVVPEQRKVVETFVRRYFGQLDSEDLAERQPVDLYGAALSHWNFARKREPGSARIRVFNPSIEEHGWQSTHTII